MTTEFNDNDNVFDIDADDFNDLPDLKVPPAGTHRFTLSLERVDNDDKAKLPLRAKFVYKEAVELANPNTPEEEFCKEGDMCMINYDLKHEFGGPAFKKDIVPVGRALTGTSNVGELLKQMKNVDVIATTKVRTTKGKGDNKGEIYKNLQIVSMELDA